MALIIRLKSPLQSFLAGSSRTFTSQAMRSHPPGLTTISVSRQQLLIRHDITKLGRKNPQSLYNQVRFNSLSSADSVEEEITSLDSLNTTIDVAMRTLDRSFSQFEQKCQREERVVEANFAKIFDFFARSLTTLGGDLKNSDSVGNISVYANILLRACGKLMIDTPPKGRELLAGNLWALLKERSVPLDISHYNSLIRTMNENGTVFDPKILLEEIKNAELKPDRITHQRLIHQYCIQGDITGATGLLEEMKNLDMELNEQTFASLIIGYLKQDTPPSINEMFDLMRNNGIDPGSVSYAAAFGTIATKLEKDPNAIERFNELHELFKKDDILFSPNDLVDVVSILAPLASKHKQVAGFIDEILPSLAGPVNMRYRILTALIRCNNFETASKLYWAQKPTERAMSTGGVGGYWIRALATNHNVPTEFAMNECQMLEDKKYFNQPFHTLYYLAATSGNLKLVRESLKAINQVDGVKMHYIWPLIAQAKDENELVNVMKNDMDPLMNSNDLVETFTHWIWPKFSNNVSRLFELNKELKYDNNILFSSYLSHAVQENQLMEAIKFITEAPQELLASSKDQSAQAEEEDVVEGQDGQTTRRTRNTGKGNLVANLLIQLADQTKDPELVQKAFNMVVVPGQEIPSRYLVALVRVHLNNEDYDKAIEEYLRVAREYRYAPCRYDLMQHCLATKNPEKLQKVMNTSIELVGENNSLYDLAICCLKCDKLKQAQKIFASPGFRVRSARVYDTAKQLARGNNVNILENFVNLARDMYDVSQEYLYQVLIETYERTSNGERALHLWNMMQEEEFQPSKKSLMMIADILERNNIEVPFQRPRDMNKRRR